MDDLIKRQDAIRLAEQGQIQGFEWQIRKLLEIPSADPETKEIGYVECSSALLKMWMDGVLTDREYDRITDKLNNYKWASGGVR